LLIAASPKRKTLDVMEKVHACPVYFHYEQSAEPVDGLRLIGQAARLLVYLR